MATATKHRILPRDIDAFVLVGHFRMLTRQQLKPPRAADGDMESLACQLIEDLRLHAIAIDEQIGRWRRGTHGADDDRDGKRPTTRFP